MEPFTARKGKWISERNNIYLGKIIHQDSLRSFTMDTNEGLSTQKLTNCEIRDAMFSCQYCNKSVCLYIQKEKMFLKNCIYLTLNMNDGDNEAKVCGILTHFIRKLTNHFFVIIGVKYWTDIPLNKTYYLRKMEKVIYLYGPMYVLLDD